MEPIDKVVAAINGKADLKYGVIVTGGGSGAINELLRHGGASNNFMFGDVPYHPKTWSNLLTSLGMPAELKKYNSVDASSILAEVAFRSVLVYTGGSEHSVGVGVTASLAKAAGQEEREGREHKAYITLRGYTKMMSYVVTFKKDERPIQEYWCSNVIIRLLAEFTNADLMLDTPGYEYGERLTIRPLELFNIDPGFDKSLRDNVTNTRVLLGTPLSGMKLTEDIQARVRPIRMIMPGSFNPPHEAHKNMMRIAEDLTGLYGWYEMSIYNIDKGRLSPYALHSRISGFSTFSNKLLVTQAPFMMDKLHLFGHPVLVVGSDTWARMWDRGNNNLYHLYESLKHADGPGCIVFSRKVNGQVQDPKAVLACSAFDTLLAPKHTIFVPPEVYCSEVSSTQLREQGRGSC